MRGSVFEPFKTLENLVLVLIEQPRTFKSSRVNVESQKVLNLKTFELLGWLESL